MVAPIPPVSLPVPTGPSSGVSASSSSAPGGFAASLGNAVDALQSAQTSASRASLGAAAGTAPVSEVVTATAQAQLATQLTVAVQNAAVTAFNDVMSL